jgi:hypothetical protein
MSDDYKEVYYNEYCPKCRYYEKGKIDDRCDKCLSEPVNLHTHRPVNFEEKSK